MARDINNVGEQLLKRVKGRVLVITGAGISADSGVPTFRGEDGYWRTYKAEELATRAAFNTRPEVVWNWYRERRAIILAAQPNAAHVAVVALAQQCQEFLLITQNIDDLHERATVAGRSLAASQIVHIHGEIFVTRCTRCGHSVTDWSSDAMQGIPRCPVCQALMRPGVVWFDEELDAQMEDRVRDFLARGVRCCARHRNYSDVRLHAAVGCRRTWSERLADRDKPTRDNLEQEGRPSYPRTGGSGVAKSGQECIQRGGVNQALRARADRGRMLRNLSEHDWYPYTRAAAWD